MSILSIAVKALSAIPATRSAALRYDFCQAQKRINDSINRGARHEDDENPVFEGASAAGISSIWGETQTEAVCIEDGQRIAASMKHPSERLMCITRWDLRSAN